MRAALSIVRARVRDAAVLDIQKPPDRESLRSVAGGR